MLRLLFQILRLLGRLLGRLLLHRQREDRFTSYLVAANRKTIDTRWQDLGRLCKQLFWKLVWLAVIIAIVWFLWESSRAFRIF